jgi:hypothetical protein
MAMLTLDLPDIPRPQAAYRLAADCPYCGARVVKIFEPTVPQKAIDDLPAGYAPAGRLIRNN